jgi:hypothetical protein
VGDCVAVIRQDAKKIGLCIDPVFAADSVTIRPIPRNMLHLVKEGEVWIGRLGLVYFHGKRDKNGKKILIQFFIPERKTTIYHALKNTVS